MNTLYMTHLITPYFARNFFTIDLLPYFIKLVKE